MNIRSLSILVLVSLVSRGDTRLFGSAVSNEGDWPRWRGPFETGMARGDAPTTWSDSRNIKWKVPIPARGHSSPVLWGDQIFITTAIPIGVNRKGIGRPDLNQEQMLHAAAPQQVALVL